MDISIIGGSDGPTVIYITSGSTKYVIVLLIVVCIAVVGLIMLKKKKDKAKK
jgi:Na+-transporting methylmalonyl-CoA/oxaloacetate decarboxylase beta subunit